MRLAGTWWESRRAPRRSRYYFNLHKSIGIVAALPILLLLFWRATHAPPPLPGSLAAWEVRAAHVNHVLFYVCLVVLVVSGFVESNFTKFGVKFFGYPLPTRLGSTRAST